MGRILGRKNGTHRQSPELGSERVTARTIFGASAWDKKVFSEKKRVEDVRPRSQALDKELLQSPKSVGKACGN